MFFLFLGKKGSFFECKRRKERCGARLPMPAGDAQMHPVSATVCGHSGLSRGKHGKPARAAAESRVKAARAAAESGAMPPVGGKGSLGQGGGSKKRFLQNPYNFLTIN